MRSTARERERPGGVRVLLVTMLWGMVVLALLCVAAPYGIGWLLAARFDRTVSQLAVPGYLQVARRHFDRGWFVSHADVVLRPVGPLCHTRPCPAVRLDSRIDHGPLAWGAASARLSPVLAVVTTRADLTELWPRYVFSPVPGPVTVHSRVGLDSRGRAELNLTGVSFDVARRQRVAHVDTATASGRLQSGWLGRRIDGLQLDWPSFSLLRQAGGHIGWRNLHLSVRRGLRGALVNGRFHADSITLDNGSGRATRLTGVALSSHKPAPHTRALVLDIDKLVLPDSTQGTFILRAREQGLKAVAWATLPGRWQQLGGWSGGALDAPALYRDVLPQLLPPGARLRVSRLELATSDGALRMTARIARPARAKAASDLAGWLAQLDARLVLTVPRPILRRIVEHTLGPADRARAKAAVDARIQALVARDLITPVGDGQRYRIGLTLANGAMHVNGRPRPQWRALVAEFQAAAPGL